MFRSMLAGLAVWVALAVMGGGALAAEVVELSVCAELRGREGARCGLVFPRGTRELYAVLSVRSAPGMLVGCMASLAPLFSRCATAPS